MAICETCDYANRPPYKSPCSECDKTMGSPFCCYEHEEKPTNADHIRAMSDEELAEMLWKTGRNYRAVCADPVVDHDEQYAELVKWLQQPVEIEEA